jgi:AcrR family transcriptional regulator
MAARKTPRRAAKKKASSRKRAPKSRAEQTEATKRRILTAALDLFETKGFAATTTKQIARRAGIAEGTVFNYFQTKDDLALYFFEREVDHAIESVRADKKLRNAPLEERLFALIQYQLEYLLPHERFLWAALMRALQPTSTIAIGTQAFALRQRYLAFVEELIADSQPRDGVNTTTWIAPHVFWIYYIGVLLFWMNDTSEGKQRTLAFVDRSLAFGVSAIRQGMM